MSVPITTATTAQDSGHSPVHPSDGRTSADAEDSGMPQAVRRLSVPVLTGSAQVIDFLVVIAAGALSFALWLLESDHENISEYAVPCLLGAVLLANFQQFRGAYRISVLGNLTQSLAASLSALCISMGMVLAVVFLSKTSADYSRGWFLIWVAGSAVGVIAWRAVLCLAVRRWYRAGRLQRAVAVVGRGGQAGRLAHHFAADPNAGIRVVTVFDRGEDDEEAVSHVERYVRSDAVDAVMIALPWADDGLERLLARLRMLPVDIRLVPDFSGALGRSSRLGTLGGMPVLNVADRPLSDWRAVFKAVEDKCLGAAILVAITPVLLGIALAVKLDSPGPVLFRQRRYGFNNQLIEVLKFRTMHVAMSDANAEQLTRRNDPRVTRVGAFLRRTSLDELPQFINVMRGEMSIVGPRPHALSAKAGGVLYQRAVAEYAARHRVKPGITGWAQVNGWRGETETLNDIRQRVEHDLYYIDNWSPWLDIKIILRTIVGGFAGQKAY
jgi:Undecaprenyl-phosphate glucose phosphotransferase